MTDAGELAYPFDYLHNALTELQKVETFKNPNSGDPAKLTALTARKARALLQRKNSLFYAVQHALGTPAARGWLILLPDSRLGPRRLRSNLR